jgi:hypothetical protein
VQRFANVRTWIWDVATHLFKKEVLTPALIALLVSGGVTPLMNGVVNNYNAVDHERADAKRQAIQRFALEADAFGPFATVFVLHVSRDNKVDAQAFERLAGNIVGQKAALDDLRWRLPPDLQTKVLAYEHALLALNGALAKVNGVEGMTEFWEKTSDLLVIRQELLPRLEAQV